MSGSVPGYKYYALSNPTIFVVELAAFILNKSHILINWCNRFEIEVLLIELFYSYVFALFHYNMPSLVGHSLILQSYVVYVYNFC